MKIFKLLCISLCLTLLSLVLVGCNKELTPQEKLLKAFNLGDNYKVTMNTTQFTVDKDGKSNGELVYINETTKEGTKYKAYANAVSTYIYTINDFSSLCSEELGMEATPENLPTIISYLNLSGMEVDYDEQNDKVTLSTLYLDYTDYYNYNASSKFKDIYATVYSVGYGGTDYSVCHALYSVDKLTTFDLGEDYAPHFIYNETDDIYEYDEQYAVVDGFENDQIIKYTIKLENGKVSKAELYYILGEETKTHLSIECSFVYGDQTVEFPTNVLTCSHDYGEKDDYHSEQVNGVYYHYHQCLYCNDIIDLGKCKFNREGHCKVCNASLTEDVVFFTYNEYDGYFDGLVYGTINAKTHKVEEVYYDMLSALELTDSECEKTYLIDGITLDTEKEEFISEVAVFEIGTEKYCYVKVDSDNDRIYILDSVTYEVVGEESITISIHGEVIQTEQIGAVYSLYR